MHAQSHINAKLLKSIGQKRKVERWNRPWNPAQYTRNHTEKSVNPSKVSQMSPDLERRKQYQKSFSVFD